ncbi:Gp138 family membrane-puncturing spike protein [Luteibacter sp.]|uniref:Gp138 family membrane-puncturing spike protein n=1 Tax=Luteibacter sp. TaxID=1886636 RepID=UPI0039C8D1FC
MGAAAGAFADEASKRLRVALPGVIVSFNPEAQTATVQPLIRQVMIDGTTQNLPVLQDVPVAFPRGGGFVLTFPVSEGDECQLVFNDRCIDGWWFSGNPSEPLDYRIHDLSDATAQVGISSQPKVIPGFEMGAVALRKLDGSAYLKIDAAGVVRIGGTKLVVDCPIEYAGGITGTGDVVADGVSLEHHLTTGVQAGSSLSGEPEQ